MQRHWFFKFLAFLLATVSGAALTLGGMGLLLNTPEIGYDRLVESVGYEILNSHAYSGSYHLARQEALCQSELSEATYNRFFESVSSDWAHDDSFDYQILNYRGEITQPGTYDESKDYVHVIYDSFEIRTGTVTVMPELAYYPPYGMEAEEFAAMMADYPLAEEPPVVVDTTPTEPSVEPTDATLPPNMTAPTEVLEQTPVESVPVEAPETLPPETLPQSYPSEVLDALSLAGIPPLAEGTTEYRYYLVPAGYPTSLEDIDPEGAGTLYYEWLDAEEVRGGTVYRIEYGPYTEYSVRMGYTEAQAEALLAVSDSTDRIGLLLTEQQKNLPLLFWGGVIGLVLSVLWLCLMAGRKPGREEVKPDGLNRLPLDLYLFAAGCGIAAALVIGAENLHYTVYSSARGYYDSDLSMWLDLSLYPLLGAGCGLIAAMFLMALAAQMKAGDNYWAKNTCIGWAVKLVKSVGWEALKGLWKLVKACVLSVGRFFGRCGRAMDRFYRMLPLMWQWLLAGLGMWIAILFGYLLCFESYNPLGWLLGIFFGMGATLAVVFYGSYCFGKLRSSAKAMAKGNLHSKLDDKTMLGCFHDFAADLNALGDTCVEAARKQMKSERMRSELITNVSHDIKTPLTSIINYVDLLQKAETEEQKQEYLEVLDRQSQRLKKLIEDLMDMSKASSGNIAAEIIPTDVTEAVHQALGEYADQMERCGLRVVTGLPGEPMMALCDGKLLWRVLNNVLSNTVKYAMPGTRVYVNAARRDSSVEISIKNISANMLNISADELMERFIRGDESRNTEGSGLGLNIARGLMELQGGALELTVDGDLFKVTLTLKGTEH